MLDVDAGRVTTRLTFDTGRLKLDMRTLNVRGWTLKVERRALGVGCWTLDVGCSDIGRWPLDVQTLNVGRWTLDVGRRTSDVGRRTLDAGRWTFNHWPLDDRTLAWTLDVDVTLHAEGKDKEVQDETNCYGRYDVRAVGRMDAQTDSGSR